MVDIVFDLVMIGFDDCCGLMELFCHYVLAACDVFGLVVMLILVVDSVGCDDSNCF